MQMSIIPVKFLKVLVSSPFKNSQDAIKIPVLIKFLLIFFII